MEKFDLSSWSWSDYALAGTSALVLVKAALYLSAPACRLPPSPPGDPIIGHARKIPLKEPHKTYAEWGKKYGDVITITAPGNTMIILNSFAAARELLDKQSAVFSGRPYVPVFELIGGANGTVFIQYGSTLPSGKALHSQVAMFLQRLLVTPESFREGIHVLVSGTIIEIVYGHKVSSSDDKYMRLVDETTRLTGEIGSIGTTIIDLLPFLRYVPAWLPGMGLKRHALKTRTFIERIIEEPFQETKTRMAAGEPFSCMVSDLLDDIEDTTEEEHERELKQAAFAVYNAGADTVKTVLLTFFVIMVLHPDVATKAQEEIDNIIGSDPERLPTFEDRNNLPYLDCVLKEVYRINPPAPLGVPHTSPEEVQLRDWKIPKKAMAITNIWQMTRDEQFFSEPEVFRPERHRAQSDSKENTEIGYGQDDPSTIIFGFGRRVCPGKVIADSIIFLSIACVLATFNIRPYTDPVTGMMELPELAFETTTVSVPKPFKCTIVPRSAKHAQLIHELSMD